MSWTVHDDRCNQKEREVDAWLNKNAGKHSAETTCGSESQHILHGSAYSRKPETITDGRANLQSTQQETDESTPCNNYMIREEIVRNASESEEDYCKRIRKINYLSLAQEFAALKKVDANALPFDLHKGNSHVGNSSIVSEDIPEPLKGCLGGVEANRMKTCLSVCEQQELAMTELPGCKTNNIADSVDPVELSHMPNNVHMETNVRDKSGPICEKQGDFDVFNIETTLPQVDWKLLESQLQRAAEEEREKSKSRQNDREEIRRKLATGIDEEYYFGERMGRKPNLQTRLQSGMNLQICFMNEVPADSDGNVAHTHNPDSNTQSMKTRACSDRSDREHIMAADGAVHREDGNNFLRKQQRLQAEATMALAQVRPMAHMQLEVEKQLRRKSPITEMVGIPGGGSQQKMNLHHIHEMNLAQLQVVVNDLHSQIENLNEELVKLLICRDDLHMEQDSMLVDIEDFTRKPVQ